jgi:hypothetical protein
MKIHVEGKTEFDKFDNFMRRLATVPHSEIKAKLDAYEKAKKRRKREKTKASASVRASSSSH